MHIDSNPLVSIFILCYNHEKYVSEAIKSAINQTYSNIEIIIVDNASTDNSRAIIESYATRDKRIKFFPLEYNSFPSAGSNFAIQQCSGEYICGLSADDYFELHKIEIQLNYMLKNNLTNTFTWVKVVNDDDQELFEHWADNLFNREILPHEMKKIFITQGNTICAITWMFHKNMFEKYGYFDHRLLQTQDFDLWLRIAQNENLNLLTQKLTCYRVRDDGNNLSINMDKKASVRSWFEATHYIRHILDFDTHLLSEITGVNCDETNKYIHLFEYYKNKNIIPYAVAVLYAMYEKLGSDFKFPSQLYNDFFATHSMFDFMGACVDRSSNFTIQLFLDYGNGFSEESSLKLTVVQSTEMQEFVFELANKQPLKALRLDPLNDSCIIEIENLRLVIENGEIDLGPYISSNTCIILGNSLFFDFNDPQIYFPNLDERALTDIKALVTKIRFISTGKDAVQTCLRQSILDKDQIIASKDLELSQIKGTLSWKITKPLRTIKQLLKGMNAAK